MTEPATSITIALAITAGGITLFGVATGLHPEVLLAGLAGGFWSLSYQPAAPVCKRLARICMAAIVAGYLAPLAAGSAASAGIIPGSISRDDLQYPAALLIGLLSHLVLGPALIRIAGRRAGDAVK